MRELKEYEKPVMEVVRIEDCNIDTLTVSTGGGDEWDFPQGWGTID